MPEKRWYVPLCFFFCRAGLGWRVWSWNLELFFVVLWVFWLNKRLVVFSQPGLEKTLLKSRSFSRQTKSRKSSLWEDLPDLIPSWINSDTKLTYYVARKRWIHWVLKDYAIKNHDKHQNNPTSVIIEPHPQHCPNNPLNLKFGLTSFSAANRSRVFWAHPTHFPCDSGLNFTQ